MTDKNLLGLGSVNGRDRVLIRMSDNLEWFLAGIPVVHDFVMQQTRRIQQGRKVGMDFLLLSSWGMKNSFSSHPCFHE